MKITREQFNKLSFSEKIEAISDSQKRIEDYVIEIVRISLNHPIEVRRMVCACLEEVEKDLRELRAGYPKKKE